MDALKNHKIAIVYGTLPAIEEIEQFAPFIEQNGIDIISSESIIGYLSQNSRFNKINCVVLPDHDDNSSFLPGLEQALEGYSIVIVKERIGLYAYQAVKAKFRHKFRLLAMVDNLCPFPGEDLQRMRTVRLEITNACDGFLVQSEAAKAALIDEGVTEDRIHYLTPYTQEKVKRNAKTRAQAVEVIGLKDTDFIILHYAQVEWEENLLQLLHAMKNAMNNDRALEHRLKLLVLGIGTFANELKQRAIALGIDDAVKYLAPSLDAARLAFQIADCVYASSQNSRDRIDGDVFKLLSPMTQGIPLLATRSPIIEEFADKHRIDFCVGSALNLSAALQKLVYAPALGKDIVAKNLEKIEKKYNEAKFSKDWNTILQIAETNAAVPSLTEIDQMVLQIESRISASQYVEAIAVIENVFASENVPSHHRANLFRMVGDCFARLGDQEAAKNAYLQALDVDPFTAKAHVGLGTISLIKNNYDIAIIHFQKAVSLAPKDAMANLGLGLAFQGLDELVEASKWVSASLQMNPDNTAAIYTIVKIAQEREEFHDAEQALRAYLKLHPTDTNMAYTLGGILFQEKKYEETLQLAEEILATNPMDGRAQSLLRQAKRGLSKGIASAK